MDLKYIDLILLHHPGTDDVKAYLAMEKYAESGKIHSIGLSNISIKIAEEHGKSVAQVILRWNVQRNIIAIPGSSNPEHIQENIGIFDFELTDEEMKEIEALDRNEKHDWY